MASDLNPGLVSLIIKSVGVVRRPIDTSDYSMYSSLWKVVKGVRAVGNEGPRR